MYAENWIYAPPFTKLKSLMKVSGGTILEIRAEQGHSGSQAKVLEKMENLRRRSADAIGLPSGGRGSPSQTLRRNAEIREAHPPKSVTAEVGTPHKNRIFHQRKEEVCRL